MVKQAFLSSPQKRGMRVVLYIAMGANGLVADPGELNDFTSREWRRFRTTVQQADCLILDRATCGRMRRAGEFSRLPRVPIIVISLQASPLGEAILVHSPAAALQAAAAADCDTALVAGGAVPVFLQQRLVDEVVLDLQVGTAPEVLPPLQMLGQGMEILQVDRLEGERAAVRYQRRGGGA